MGTDLELYRVFCEVVKYKNITKTAESMYMSQSAITQSIQKLEKMLGGKVFYRNKNGVELTEEGKNLYEYIKDSVETMNNAENIFSEYINLEKGELRIGGGNALISSLILEPLNKFIKEYPNIKVSIISGLTDDLIQKLSNGELDMIVLNLPYNNKYSSVEILKIKSCSYAFFATKKYIEENSINNFEDIFSKSLILPKQSSSKNKILKKYFDENSIEVNPKYEVSSSSIMKNMVLNDIGIGFTNIENLNDINKEIKIIKEIKFDDYFQGIAMLKKNMCNKATIEFYKTIKEFYNI